MTVPRGRRQDEYKTTHSNMNTRPNMSKQQVVVSLTSFPAAAPYAAKAIQSVINGSVTPDRIVLYLTFAQFGTEGIPEELTRMAEQNPVFEIRNYDTDIRSYRKLIPALRDFPDAVIVTIDDDVAYHPNMLRDLLRLHDELPEAVIAHRAKLMKRLELPEHLSANALVTVLASLYSREELYRLCASLFGEGEQ